MKQSSNGFSLIEIALGIGISTLIITLGFRLIASLTLATNGVQGTTDYIGSLAITHDVWERDCAGIFVPEATWTKIKQDIEKEKKQETTGKESPDKTPQSSDTQTRGKAGDEKKDTKEPPVAFSCTGEEKKFSQLSFITTNHVAHYGIVSPYAVLVLYRLVPSASNDKCFMLLRSETNALATKATDLIKDKKVQTYTIMDNIKNFSVALFYQKIKEKKDKNQKQQPEKTDQKEQEEEKKEYEKVFDWDEKAMRKKKLAIPAYIEISGTLFDHYQNTERPFLFIYKIQAFDAHLYRMKEPKEQPITPIGAPAQPGQMGQINAPPGQQHRGFPAVGPNGRRSLGNSVTRRSFGTASRPLFGNSRVPLLGTQPMRPIPGRPQIIQIPKGGIRINSQGKPNLAPEIKQALAQKGIIVQ